MSDLDNPGRLRKAGMWPADAEFRSDDHRIAPETIRRRSSGGGGHGAQRNATTEQLAHRW